MTDTEVVEAPEAEEVTEAPDDEELQPDDTLEPDDEAEVIDGPDESDEILASAQTEKEIEKRNRSLEREAERHEKRIRELLGDDAEGLIKCEACPETISGFHYGPEDYPPDSSERVLYELLAGGDASMMRHPEYLETCGECNGFGMVLTGSRTDLTKQLTCPICKGAGYIDTRENQPPALIPDLPAGEAPSVVPAAATDELERDMWGRPKDSPRFGKFPIYLTDEERAADVADGYTID